MTRGIVYTQNVSAIPTAIWFDIKWGTRPFRSPIGRSITVVTPAAVGRYIAALGGSGKVY